MSVCCRVTDGGGIADLRISTSDLFQRVFQLYPRKEAETRGYAGKRVTHVRHVRHKSSLYRKYLSILRSGANLGMCVVGIPNRFETGAEEKGSYDWQAVWLWFEANTLERAKQPTECS